MVELVQDRDALEVELIVDEGWLGDFRAHETESVDDHCCNDYAYEHDCRGEGNTFSSDGKRLRSGSPQGT